MQIQPLDHTGSQPTNRSSFTLLRTWLPTPGNVVFTLIVVIGVLWAQNAGALALFVTPPPINIPYQGRLADRAGASLGGDFKITFALYNTAAGGIPLWSETYQDANKVRVNNGLFNVLLGSLAPIDQSVITANPELYLGVTINDDTEMQPRVKLGSVPFATQAWTVPDGSVTMAKLGPDVKLSLPTGSVILWSGVIAAIPSDWQLCDGTNGMPDLRNRFVVGAGAAYAPGATGGVDQMTLSVDQMPSHNHSLTIDAAGLHSHGTRLENEDGFSSGSSQGGVDNTGGAGTIRTTDDGSHSHSGTIGATGGNQPFDNRPPYYALAFICKK